MTSQQKAQLRLKFRIAAMVILTIQLIMAFILAYQEKDLTGFGLVTGTIDTPLAALLVADYATTPKSQ